jgi:hypothetical protein
MNPRINGNYYNCDNFSDIRKVNNRDYGYSQLYNYEDQNNNYYTKKCKRKTRPCCHPKRFKGPTGPTGPTGIAGPTGVTGPTGRMGKPAQNCCELRYIGPTNVMGSVADPVSLIPNPQESIGAVRKTTCDPVFEWANQAGGIDSDIGASTSVDCDGNIYVTGSFSNTATFGTSIMTSIGDSDIFVAKLDTDGNWLWTSQAGGVDTDSGISISHDYSGNSYVIGTFESSATFGTIYITSSGENDIFIAKLDSMGSWKWVQQAGGIFDDRGTGISVDCNDNVYVAGLFAGTATFGSTILTTNDPLDDNENNIFIAKLDSDGIWQWTRAVEGDNFAVFPFFFSNIDVDCRGNSYVTGSFGGTATFGPFIRTVELYSPFITKLDTNGVWQWVQTDTSGFSLPSSVSLDCEGNSYVIGFFAFEAEFGPFKLTQNVLNDQQENISALDVADVFIAKLSTNNNWEWAIQAGGVQQDVGFGISTDCEGNSYITGSFQGVANFGQHQLISSGTTNLTNDDNPINIFIASIDPCGKWKWAIQAGGEEGILFLNSGVGISVDCHGNAYATGAFIGEATFGQHLLTSFGFSAMTTDSDIFITKVNDPKSKVRGFLKEDASDGELVDVYFPNGNIATDIFTNLKPVCKYYLDENCELTNCCECSCKEEFVGVALTENKMLTGVCNSCHK